MTKPESTDAKRSRITALLGLQGRKDVSLGELLEIVEEKLSVPVNITETMRAMAAVVLEARNHQTFFNAATMLAKEIVGDDGGAAVLVEAGR